MTDEFTHRILRMVIGRVCQPLGVHGMQQSVCDCMADVLKQFIPWAEPPPHTVLTVFKSTIVLSFVHSYLTLVKVHVLVRHGNLPHTMYVCVCKIVCLTFASEVVI